MSGIELGWGLDVILWFQSWRTPFVESLGLFFSFLGSTDFYLVVLPLIFWSIDERAGLRVGLFFLLSIWLNSVFKMAWRRPRPYMVSTEVDVPPPAIEPSYGIPSGHAQGTATLWGAIAVEVKQRWVTVSVIVYTLMMAVSRMVIGTHYPQDVIAGLLIGGLLVGLYAWLEPKFNRWITAQSLLTQIGVVVLGVGFLLILHPGIIPVSIPPNLTILVTLDDVLSWPVSPAAALLGTGIGFALEYHYLRFDASGIWWKRALRFVLGMVGLAVLRFGLGALFEGLEPPLVFRLIRYSIIGLWIGFGAPWLFIKLNLARSAITG